MSAGRTQIDISEEQRRRIDAAAAAQGLTRAEIIRRAIDAYLGTDVDLSATLAATFGADPSAHAHSRGEWNRG
jgi:predicted DNA-binding protein